MRYADPLAQAEIDRLTTENADLVVAIKRLQELAWGEGWRKGFDVGWYSRAGKSSSTLAYINPYQAADET